MIVARALDKGHKLQRVRKVRTFQQMSASNMVSKIASRGRPDGPGGEYGRRPRVLPAERGDRLGLHRPTRAQERIPVRSGGPRARLPARRGRGAPTTLKWEETLISFRPRASGVQQVKTINVRGWDPKNKQAVTGSAATATTTSRPGSSAAGSTDRGRHHTPRPSRGRHPGEANALAKSALDGRATSRRGRGPRRRQPEDQGRRQGQDRGRRRSRRGVPRLLLHPRLQRAGRATRRASRSPGGPSEACETSCSRRSGTTGATTSWSAW